MDTLEIRQKVFQVISTVMEIPIDQITEDSSSQTIENWDSMTQMSLILALSEEFKIRIGSAQANTLLNVKLILAALEDLLQKK